MIAGVAFFVLSRFPRTLEQDKQLLAGLSLPDDVSMAVQFRLAKKQIIAQLLHDLASRIKVCLATHQSPTDCGSHAFRCTQWPACVSMAVQISLREMQLICTPLVSSRIHHEGACKSAILTLEDGINISTIASWLPPFEMSTDVCKCLDSIP